MWLRIARESRHDSSINNKRIQSTNSALLENIESRHGFWSADRIDSLAPRKIEEIEFHNLDRKQSDDAEAQRDELDMHANRKWYLVTENSRRYTDRWIQRHAKDKVFLDYACGSGQTTLRAAVPERLTVRTTTTENTRKTASIMITEIS